MKCIGDVLEHLVGLVDQGYQVCLLYLEDQEVLVFLGLPLILSLHFFHLFLQNQACQHFLVLLYCQVFHPSLVIPIMLCG